MKVRERSRGIGQADIGVDYIDSETTKETDIPVEMIMEC